MNRFKLFLIFVFCLITSFGFALDKTPPTTLVIFGATGDLTARKLLPSLYHLEKEGVFSENTVIIGIGRKALSNKTFRDNMLEAVAQFSRTKPIQPDLWQVFKNKINYFKLDFDNAGDYEQLRSLLQQMDQQFGTQGNRLYYLATAPSYFTTIIHQLSEHQLISDPNDASRWSRVVIEKPFGHDLHSAIALQDFISQRLDEKQTFRMDHYLGKVGVDLLMKLRFVDKRFEAIWNYQGIDHVQITLSEQIGIGSRGFFWEETGALRDLFQNHLMQLLSMMAMESPEALTADQMHERKIQLLNAIQPFPMENLEEFVVRGQYGPGISDGKSVIGYRDEQEVSKTSNVETYIAAKILINNERWQGVPFYIRAGKRLQKQATEIIVHFKNQALAPLVIRIQPNPAIVQNGAKIDLDTDSIFPEAYEKLLYDAFIGDSRTFVHAEEQLAAWRLLTPVLEKWNHEPPVDGDFPNYASGSWGPQAADRLLQQNGHHWQELETP